MKILVTGGSGYKGSVLIPRLLEKDHKIINIDTQWFGDNLEKHPNLENIKGDIRDLSDFKFNGIDSIIHLANVANDPAVDLNPNLSWEINVLAGYQFIDKAIRGGVKQFIYASSGSVYGVKEEENVTEDLPLVPISVYNKTKMVAERVFLSYKDKIKVHCIRPATVCGLSPRLRLDVSVNLLTYQALKNGLITVYGGKQTRPNIHIDDMVNIYQNFLNNPNIKSGCYNAGFENISILEIAETIKNIVPTKIKILESNDPRSYRQNRKKLLSTGFIPKKTIHNAIVEIAEAFYRGEIKESSNNYTVKKMIELNIGEN